MLTESRRPVRKRAPSSLRPRYSAEPLLNTPVLWAVEAAALLFTERLIVFAAASCQATKKYHVFVEIAAAFTAAALADPSDDTLKRTFVPSNCRRYSSEPAFHFAINGALSSVSRRIQPAIVKSMS